MYAEERQQDIVLLAQEHGRVAVAELAHRFDVTTETVRRDLDALAAKGFIARVHGGAVPADKVRLVESAVPVRQETHTDEKRRIAHAALALLPDRPGGTVLLDAGTTTAMLAEALTPGSLSTVVTNSTPIASALATRQVADVHLLGGRVRGLTQATVGAPTVEALRDLRVDVAFLGTNGFSLTHGFSTPDPSEAAVKRAMVTSANLVVVLADSSKAGTDYLVSFARPEDVDVLVTDTGLGNAAANALSDLTKVVFA
ncbi:MAG: DeoR/GlpR family DNA-binding transcription regulator [Actinomycetota bacterium]